MHKHLLLIPIVFLAACEKLEPITIPAEKSEYFGVWEHQSDEFGNGVKTDHMLFAIFKDSTVSYKRCTKKLNGHQFTTAPNNVITSLTDKNIIIATDLYVTSIDMEFTLDQPPYLDNGNWYMQLDGVTLRKLREGEKSDHETWECDSNSQDDGY